MRPLWTLVKLVLALAIGIPLAIIAMSMAVGLLSAFVGLAAIVLRFAIVGLVIYMAFRFVIGLFTGGGKRDVVRTPQLAPPAPVDPYYEAAKRELDRELG